MSADEEKILEPKQLSTWVREQEERPESPWLIKDWMQCDSAIQITGPATTGHKTWFGMSIAMIVGSGKPVELLQPAATQTPVLYCLQEGPSKPSAGRFRQLERGLGIQIADLPIHFSHRRQFFLDDDYAMRWIGSYARDNGIKLVVIDTLAKVNRGDENSSKDIGNCMRGIDKIRNAAKGCSVLYLHHVGKPPSERQGPRDIDDETRGSSALAGGYDIHIAVRKRMESQKHLDVTVRGNQLQEKYYALQWYIEPDKAHFTLHVTKPGMVPDTLKDELANKLQEDQGYTQGDLERVWGISRSQVKQVIAQLEDENTLEYKSKQYWLT